MDSVEKATQTQLSNIQKRTGKTLKELTNSVQNSGLEKHSEIREYLIKEFHLGYGDATVLAGYAKKTMDPENAIKESMSIEEILDNFYSGPKAGLRPIHERVMEKVAKIGEFTITPKKTYLSLRRKRQFAMIGPGTNTLIDVGLNMKGIKETDRLIALKPGGMCQYKLRLSSEEDVNQELIAWIRKAYESAG